MGLHSPLQFTPPPSGFSTFLLFFLTGFAVCMIGSTVMRSWLPSFFTRVDATTQELASRLTTGESVAMTLVVRKDLKMGTGKIAAQCAHAAVASVEEMIALQRQQQSAAVKHPWVQWYEAWHVSGCTKVALRCEDEEEMMRVARDAKANSIPYYIIRDAGRTQIAAGSKTVVAVGPAPKSIVDKVTGNLRLL